MTTPVARSGEAVQGRVWLRALLLTHLGLLAATGGEIERGIVLQRDPAFTVLASRLDRVLALYAERVGAPGNPYKPGR